MEHIKDTLFYDGSFNGFLTLIHEVQARNIKPESIQKKQDQQEVLFMDSRFIPTEIKKARSVWNYLRSKNYGALKLLYFAFLSEEQNIETKLFQFYRKFSGSIGIENTSMSVADNLHIEQLANLVEKEKCTIERTLYIDHTGDRTSIHTIQPRYNILPLISKFFRTRYKEQEWVIYDSKRSYGIHHRDGNMAFTALSPDHLEPFFSENNTDVPSHDRLQKIDTLGKHFSNKKGPKSRHIQAVA